MSRGKMITIAVYLGIVLALVGGGVLTAHLVSPLLVRLGILPNDQIVDFHTYYSIEKETVSLIWDGARIVTEPAPVYENGEAHLPLSTVREYMDPFIFLDEYANTLFVTSDTDVLEFKPGDYFTADGEVYIPAALLAQLYPYRVEYNETYNIVAVDDIGARRDMARVIKKTGVRYNPEAKSELALEAEEGEIVTVYKPEGEYTQVLTRDGLPGYITSADMEPLTVAEAEGLAQAEPPEPLLGEYIDNKKTAAPNWQGGKINMMWDGVYVDGGNAAQMAEPVPAGVNVLSPTWFEIEADTFELKSLAGAEYVGWAHGQGISVWPRLFDGKADRAKAVLTDAARRKRIVEEICGYAESLDLDGINVDFESVQPEDGDYFIQFLRELNAGLGDRVLSVDVLVPMDWSRHYRRGDIAVFADFLCLMAYDEHHYGSDISGPVASLSFVEKGITGMLEVMPKEKLVLGLAFFNRIWIEAMNSGARPDPLQYGMERTKQLLLDHGVTQPEWDAETGSFYGEYALVQDGETLLHRVWLEDENSIREKLKILEAHGLAGAAGWSRGFENAAVHELLREALS